MPTWPTSVTTTGMDADTDTLPRSDILDLATKFNDLIAMRGVAGGMCDLDGSGIIPVARIPAAIARLASPVLTGTPTGPNAALRTNTTQLATTAFVLANMPLTGVLSRSAAYTLLAADYGKLVDATTGTWNLGIDPALGAGPVCGVRNSGSGVITLVPTTGTIDGAASVDLGPGESCLVESDATNLLTVGRTIAPPGAVLATTTKTSGTSHTLNAKTTHVMVEMVGGGGGGAGRNPGAGQGGGGGGAGCYVRTLILPTGGASSLTYAVGGGGGGGGDNVNGGGGGNSSVTINGTTYTAYGGGGGISSTGSNGANGSKIQSVNAISIPGTSGPSASGPTGGYGGASIFSGYVAQNTAGAVGGGGGGAYYSAPAAGAGGTGQVIITEYKL